ncbi:MAG: hypothetical protein Q3962_04790 [Corynebacterium sp.]|nr:hypothetical protein [Corynebacterium sp.]
MSQNTNQNLYVSLNMVIPEAGINMLQFAELRPLGGSEDPCEIIRFIEFADGSSISGGLKPGASTELSLPPQPQVPHPDLYDQFPDITAEMISPEDFEASWVEAQALFPELRD